MGDTEVELDAKNIYASLTANSLTASLIKDCQLKVTLRGGYLKTCSLENSLIEIDGKWAECYLKLYSDSKISTQGSCKGDYKCRLKKNSILYRRGSIGGTYTEDLSDNAKVIIF